MICILCGVSKKRRDITNVSADIGYRFVLRLNNPSPNAIGVGYHPCCLWRTPVIEIVDSDSGTQDQGDCGEEEIVHRTSTRHGDFDSTRDQLSLNAG